MNNERIIDALLEELNVDFDEACSLYTAGELTLTDEQEDALIDEMAKVELLRKNFTTFLSEL